MEGYFSTIVFYVKLRVIVQQNCFCSYSYLPVDSDLLFCIPDGSPVMLGRGAIWDVSFDSGIETGDSVLELLLEPPLSPPSLDFI